MKAKARRTLKLCGSVCERSAGHRTTSTWWLGRTHYKEKDAPGVWDDHVTMFMITQNPNIAIEKNWSLNPALKKKINPYKSISLSKSRGLNHMCVTIFNWYACKKQLKNAFYLVKNCNKNAVRFNWPCTSTIIRRIRASLNTGCHLAFFKHSVQSECNTPVYSSGAEWGWGGVVEGFL